MTVKHLPRHGWFSLSRHEDPPADPPKAADPPADPPKPDEALGDAGKKALAEERAGRKAAEKALAEREARLKAFEDAQKTEAEKLAERADAAEKREQAATARAVKAEIKALADGFTDRDDAVLNLGDLGKYVKDGDVDTDAIAEALSKVLERKPHLGKASAARTLAPDPSQGRGGNTKPTDFTQASQDEFAAELGKYGLRPQSYS